MEKCHVVYEINNSYLGSLNAEHINVDKGRPKVDYAVKGQ